MVFVGLTILSEHWTVQPKIFPCYKDKYLQGYKYFKKYGGYVGQSGRR